MRKPYIPTTGILKCDAVHCATHGDGRQSRCGVARKGATPVVSQEQVELSTAEFELLAERIDEYRVFLMAIEEELLDALSSIVTQRHEPAAARD